MSIQIQGDGNTVGDGNQIFVKKTTINNNNNEPKKSDEEIPTGFAIILGIAAALAIATWKFAQYAPLIYAILILTGFSIVAIKVLISFSLLNKLDKPWLIDQLIGLIATIMVTIGVWLSNADYGTELTQHALVAQEWRIFFCGLNPYGVQLASYHLLTMVLLAVPTFIFLIVDSIGSLARMTAYITGIQFIGKLATIQKRRFAIAALIFGILCLLSQTDITQAAWAEWIMPKSELLLKSVCR